MDFQSYGSFNGRFRTKIALACMTYTRNLDAYELHPGDEKNFNDIVNEYLGSLLYIR